MPLVLVGPPGSGKGTQAELLVSRLGLAYVGTGAILRDAIARATPTGLRVQPIMDRGLLVPDEVVNQVVADLFRGPERPERFVMDGYPRTQTQAVSFDALLAEQDLKLDAVVDLDIADDEVVRRISSRRCCSNKACGVCFNVAFRPPKAADVCDNCGRPLVLRDDDSEPTVRRRLTEFHNNTDALIAHYKARGLLREVSALDGVETIYRNVVAALPKK